MILLKNVVLSAVMCLLASSASAQVVSRVLGTHKQVFYQSFTLHEDQDLSIWTSSHLAGSFDPALSLWWQGILLASNDSRDYDVINMSRQDAGIGIALAAGTYTLALGVAGNLPAGLYFGEGFVLDEQAPIPMSQWCDPSGACGRGNGFTIHFDFGGSASLLPMPLPPVPEPAGYAMLLAGLALGVARQCARAALTRECRFYRKCKYDSVCVCL